MPPTVAEVRKAVLPHTPRVLRGTGCQQLSFLVKKGEICAQLLSHGQEFLVVLDSTALSKTGCQLASYITLQVLKKRGIA
jgi:hypothetical protein